MYDEEVLGDVFDGADTGLNADVDSSLVLPESDSLSQDGGLCLVKLKCSIAFKRSWLHLKKKHLSKSFLRVQSELKTF